MLLFGKLCVRTLQIARNSVFINASMMHLKAIILRIFIEKSWFGWATNYKKCVRKPILVNLRTQIFKKFPTMQTVVVLPGETNKSNLLPFFSSLAHAPSPNPCPPFESWFVGPYKSIFSPYKQIISIYKCSTQTIAMVLT